MNRVLIGVLFVCNLSLANAGEMQLGSQNPLLEKINFVSAIQSAKAGKTREERRLVLTAGDAAHQSPKSLPAYENGDVYYLTGNLADSWTSSEWDRYYGIAKWLVKSHFRVIMNPLSLPDDVREAVQSPLTSIIIWSSHGDNEGTIYDSSDDPLPADVFSSNASASLRQIIFSNCYGEMTVKHYALPSGVNIKHWIGETTSDDLFTYLLSDQWDHDLAL